MLKGNALEKRLAGTSVNEQELIEENKKNLAMCQKYGLEYILIDKEYKPEDFLKI